jgi:SAM-dependent methyltransferase
MSGLTPRQQRVREAADRSAAEFDRWRALNSYFHEEDARYLRFVIAPGLRILELGCGGGDLLASLKPAAGIGVDFSPAMIAMARERHPELEFRLANVEDATAVAALGPMLFDVILLSDTIGSLEDIQQCFEQLHALCGLDTRIVLSFYSQLWEPIVRLAERLGLKMPTPLQNWLSSEDIRAFLELAGFETIKREWHQILPKRLFGIGPFVNRYLGSLPLLRRLALRSYVVLRSRRAAKPMATSVSVIVPCRNERGNIEAVVRRLPAIAPRQEIVFVEGHSRDGTLEEILRVKALNPDRDIKVLVQDGKGKGDAVRKGFDAATGDILMILDADLTVPPESLPKFYGTLADGQGEFASGTRLVYPLEAQAMRLLNLFANLAFAAMFTFLLNQRTTDTLCGTKALFRRHYRKIAAGRGYFGDLDPFGDFDLLFGAAKLNLKTVEIPVRYVARSYGETQISRFRHGWLLLRMAFLAWWKLKAI